MRVLKYGQGLYNSEFALIPGPYYFFILRPPWSDLEGGQGERRDFVKERERGLEAVADVREVWQRARRKEDEEDESRPFDVNGHA